MRPVNLIPPDERRGDRAAMRTGVFSYVLIGALAAAVLAVAALGLTSKQISDKKSEIAQLQVQEQQAQAKAQSLVAFTNFRAAQEARSSTIVSLAQSRFDWQRVLNEFARVIPSDVWFVKIAGTVDATVSVQDQPDIQGRDSVAGPALEMEGCASSQDAVAGLIANLQEIDGVTRVGLESSEKADDSSGGGATAAPASGDSGSAVNTDCRTRDFITQFKIVAGFDAVPAPSTATSAPSVPAGVPTTGGSQLTSQPASTSGSGG
ncbi:MAG TPA: PilN domain-containing protein [Solirubrobacterales bacterium]|nr:PilN domain-containing protein [Solirubrobacterales bacterium]